jgi:hypothetical protein
VFRFHVEEALKCQYTPDDALREQVERQTAAAHPMRAIPTGHVEVG